MFYGISDVVEDQTSLLQDLSGMILSRSPTSVNVSEDTSEKDGNSPTPLPVSKEGCEKCLINEKKLKRQQLYLDKMNKLFLRREQAFNRMQKNLNAARQKVRRLEHKLEVSTQDLWATSLKNIFQEDQMKYLTLGYKKVPKWCSDTLLKALKLRFACGTSGYEEILKLNFPFPSVRTLVRKMENLKFKPGCVILEIVQFLEIKVNSFQDFYKDCVLVLDEMSITPGSFYDTSTNTFLGTVTLPEHDQSQIATHALVFMLAGLGARWKQIIRFDFTPDSVNGRVFKTIIDEIILKIENIGLRVHCVTSDMGPANQAMWNAYGINASRYSTISNSCTHPYDEKRQLYFYADAPHAFKNLKTAFLNSSVITIPNDFVIFYKLPTDTVDKNYVYELFDKDEGLELKLAPKLTKQSLNTKDHFAKMKVSNAKKVLSEDVASGLSFLASDLEDERHTTAWFVEFLSKWFTFMCSRNINFSLSYHDDNKFNEAISFLKEVILFFTELKVGAAPKWKPYQTAILISTQTVIDLSQYLLNRNFTFFFPSRLTQDCLENLFSIVRLKNVVPHAVQFKNNLKLICISQYMREVSKSNYDQDDRQFLSEFIEILEKNRSSQSHFIENITSQLPVITEREINISTIELNVLYYIAGYICDRIEKYQKVCDTCIKSIKLDVDSVVSKDYNRLCLIKARKTNRRFFVNDQTFDYFLRMEKMYRLYFNNLRDKRINLKSFFIAKFNEIEFDIPDCHHLKLKIISKFYAYRLKIKSSKQKKIDKNYIYASKSVAMREIVK